VGGVQAHRVGGQTPVVAAEGAAVLVGKQDPLTEQRVAPHLGRGGQVPGLAEISGLQADIG